MPHMPLRRALIAAVLVLLPTVVAGLVAKRPAASPNSEARPNPETPTPVPLMTIQATADELELLSRLVAAEAAGEPFAGQVAVAAVVVNRLHHPEFPASIREIVYQDEGLQFEPVLNGTINRPADDTSRQAAAAALAGADPTGGALFFYNPRLANSPFLASRKVIAYIGNHQFLL